MTILDIIALSLQAGDKVHIVFAHKDKDGNNPETDAFFGGFRCWDNICRDFYSFLPIFYEVGKDGNQSRRLLLGESCFSPSTLLSVRRTSPMRLTADAVEAICNMKYNIDREAHQSIVDYMKRYVELHPGRPKVYLNPDDSVSATYDDKYASFNGTIYAVSFKNGQLFYDVNTEMDLKKDAPDYRDARRGCVFVPDETYILKVLLNQECDPYVPKDEEDFFDFIKVNETVRWIGYNKKRLGPLVKVVGTHDFPKEGGPVWQDTHIRIIPEGEEEVITVKASELEPAK